jgi:outer membrane protein assembly factor BamB
MRSLIFSGCLMLAASVSYAQSPALEGLDPVLLVQGKEVPGKSEFSEKHGRFLYEFSSAETRETFRKDPERWGIQLGGACARMGDPVRGNPDSYHVHDGRIYIFGSTECYQMFKENPSKFLSKPVVWKPAPADLQKGSAMLAEIRAALGLKGMTGWSEKRKTTRNERTATAKLPFSIEAETVSRRFTIQESVSPEKVEQKVQNQSRVMDPRAAAVTRAVYGREFLWLISGSLDAIPSSGGGGAVDVYTGAEIITVEIGEGKRPVAARWKGRGLDGGIADLRVAFVDYREAQGGGMIPFRGEASIDGKPSPELSWEILSCAITRGNAAAWEQWGGPHRDFQIAAAVHPWPESGPKSLWTRKLGDGYSSIVSDGRNLYTLYRQGDEEVVLAASALTGETVWEHRYRAPMFAGFEDAQGPGPRATPLLDGGLIYSIGASGLLHCLQRDSGKVVWSLDLQKDFGAKVRARGYSVSPMAWKDNVIVLAGGPGAAVVSLRKKDGKLVWKSRDEQVAYASPFVMQVPGAKPVLVTLMAKEILGLDPDTGELRWSHPHSNSELVNASTPVGGEDGILVVSSAYDGGCRALQVTADGVKELWSHRLLRIHHGNAVRIGTTVYGSSGDSGPAPLTALDVRTGKVLWRDRSLGKSSMLAVGEEGKRLLLLLDEEGKLQLVDPQPEAPKVLAKTQLMSGLSWTVPSLVAGRLYVRTRTDMAAFELP